MAPVETAALGNNDATAFSPKSGSITRLPCCSGVAKLSLLVEGASLCVGMLCGLIGASTDTNGAGASVMAAEVFGVGLVVAATDTPAPWVGG
jgi:hypothetical protein